MIFYRYFRGIFCLFFVEIIEQLSDKKNTLKRILLNDCVPSIYCAYEIQYSWF